MLKYGKVNYIILYHQIKNFFFIAIVTYLNYNFLNLQNI